MTTIDHNTILNEMAELQYEPTRIIPLLMGMTEEALDGGTIVTNPSAPLPHLMEMSVVLALAGIQEDQILNTRQYPIQAVDDETLFYHLSDKDFEGMFDSPSEGVFSWFFSVDEIVASAVPVGNTGTKRLTIPKHTRIVVNNTAFTFQYAINFIVKKNGGIDVVYDGSRPSPLQKLSGNKVKTQNVNTLVDPNSGGFVEMVRVDVPIKQMLLTSYTYSLSGAKSLKKVLTLTDKFYYVRAFSRNTATKGWDEIKTTNSIQSFDPTDPTLLYKLVNNELTIELPYVYFATNLTTKDIRVDVYTTKGEMTMSLSGLPPEAFVATYSDLDNDDAGIYKAPLSTMNTISIVSTDLISGGANAPTFEERRKRVLSNAVGDAIIPVSDLQMKTTLDELGFDSMKPTDVVTERTFLATRAMPVNEAGVATTGIDSAVITAKFAIADLLQYETVIDNGQRFTVTPKTLYRYIDGVLTIVKDADRKAIDLLKGDPLINKVSDGTYLWTPLHYVLDTANFNFEVRPYYLNAPEIDIKSFIASNDTLGLTVSSSNTMSIVRDDAGYLLTVRSSSNDAWQALRDDQVHVQLAFKPVGESDYAYVNGVQIAKNGERIYTFRLNSNWDINGDHELNLSNFSMYEPEARNLSTYLTNEFSLIWSVSDYTVEGAATTAVDQVLGDFLLPDDSTGIYHEELTLKLGDELTGLWALCRDLAGLRKVLTYDEVVYQTWDKNYYEFDADKQPVFEVVDGVKQLKIKHKKGDFVLNADGDKTVLHYINDAVLDENGNPIYESERNVIHWWDVCLFDGVYRYATKGGDLTYVKEVPQILNEWINEVLAPVRQELFERTDLFFQPRNTLKFVEATVQDSELVTLHTSQSLTVTLWVSKEVYGNTDLRDAMEVTTIARVVAGLDNQRVSRNVIETDIYNNLGANDVIGASLTGLGGADKDYDVITLSDASSRLCIAKALEAQADGTYSVVDAIEVNFKLHQPLQA
jgi:hypothetical protein